MRIIGTLFGVIFGMIFVAAGIQIALETAIPTYQSWQEMKSWQPVSAQLLSVKESANNVAANYGFSISSNEYSSDRVYVAPFNDNIGSYHHDMYLRLQGLKDKNLPVSIWYDPLNPNLSVIDRDMRWGLFTIVSVFCSLFILIGFAVIYFVIGAAKSKHNSSTKPSLSELRKQWKQLRAESNYQGSFTDYCEQQTRGYYKPRVNRLKKFNSLETQPWLSRTEWRSYRITSGSKKKMFISWIFAIIWIGVSTPILFVVKDETNKGHYLALFALIFPLIGLFLIKTAWRITRQWQRQGEIEIELDPYPGSIGGHVGGSLLVKNVHDFNIKYKIELQCVYNYYSGNGKQRSRRESIKWEESGFAKNEVSREGIRIKFRFDVPEGLPESDINHKGNYYVWRINVSSDSPGNALKSEYIIPVFNTQTQSTKIRHDISSQAEEIRENKALEVQAAMSRGDFSSTALNRSLVYKNKGNEQVFYYPMFRNKFLTLFALIFAGAFSFAAYSIYTDMGDGGIVEIGMFIFSLPFALVGLMASIAAIYLLFNNLTVTLSGRQLRVIRRLFIFPIKKSLIQGAEIKKMEVKSTGSTGEGARQIKHYKLIAHTADFKKVTLAEDIDGEDLANQLKEFICKRLFISC